MRARSAAFLAGLAALTALGLALRLRGTAGECFWFDEVAQLEWSDQPFGAFLLDRWQQVDPPLNEIVAWFWNGALRAFAPGCATSEFWVRIPVIAMGTALIPALGATARRAFGPAAGLVAAALTATNPYLVRYSQEARMYALTMLAAAAALGFLVRALDGGGRRHAAGFAIASALAALSHFYALLILFAAAGATAWSIARSGAGGSPAQRWRAARPELRMLLIAEAAAIVPLCLAFLFAGMHMMSSGQGTRPWLTGLGKPGFSTALWAAEGYATDLLYAFVPAAGGGADSAVVWAAVASCALLIAGGAARGEREPAGLRTHLLWIAFAPTLVVFALSQARPLYHMRYLVCCAPAMILIASRIRPAPLGAALCAAPMLAGAWVAPRYDAWTSKPNYRDAAKRFVDEAKEGDRVSVSLIDRLPIRYYVRTIAGADSAAYRSIDAVAASSPSTLDPSLPSFVKSAPRQGSRELIFDCMAPWGRLYAMDARAALQARLAQGVPRADGWRLLYASSPMPSIRLWASEK